MKASEGPEPAGRWLLIGNSRWHWAEGGAERLRCWSEPPPAATPPKAPPPAPPPSGAGMADPITGWITAWAAVGPGVAASGLDPRTRLTLEHVPLGNLPPWLGIDRALVGWQAWSDSQGPVLVADAGTALSLTRVDGAGRFAGGRLLAGAALQWRALAEGTVGLPAIPLNGPLDGEPWPERTAEALRTGVLRGLAAAVQAAWQEALQVDRRCGLWITGGDGPALGALLGQPCDGQLALRALAGLRPERGR
ncbi:MULTISPECIES: type III pantothenate kinase [Aphanothece]|uniref:type III pantothenate kinase n=1 Tax=Aphanothece TaxID=1121 RepID=UPI0039852566